MALIGMSRVKRPQTLIPRRDTGKAVQRVDALRYPRHGRKVYDSGAWKRARLVILARGPLCAACGIEAATDVDHIVPLRDGGAPFDAENLQPLCRVCHSEKTAHETVPQRIPNWVGPSGADLTIVCGAPGSGKTTWVAGESGDEDTVIDLDMIISDLSGKPIYQDQSEWLSRGIVERNMRLAALSGANAGHRAWFIVSAPRAQDRDRWRTLLKPSRVVVLETSLDECCRRIMRDPRREGHAAQHCDVAAEWWSRYRRAEGDEIVSAREVLRK